MSISFRPDAKVLGRHIIDVFVIWDFFLSTQLQMYSKYASINDGYNEYFYYVL